MEGGSSGKKKGASRSQDHGFAELIFSWSLDDIVNDGLYEHQVEKIPLTFQSEEHYFRSFVYPLLEETRTELASTMKMMYRAPFAEISSLRKAKGKEKMMYDVTVGDWRNSERRKELYRTLPGDLLILANGEPGSVSDLQSNKWAFLLVNNTEDDDGTPVQFKVTASQEIEIHDGMFVVFLMNITTQKRIWNSLHKHANLDIIKEILYPDSMVKEQCDKCSLGCNNHIQRFDPSLVSKLNESQKAAIMAAIRKMDCSHKSSVEQIWGPPGTGKTMTVSVMLSIFLQVKCRTLTCAPTNVAIVAVASRVLTLVKESSKTITANGDSFYSVGDLLLFGNKDRLKVGTNIEEIYLDHRVEKLIECLGSLTGWKHCIKSMIDLLEDCVSQYHVFVENEKFKEEQLANEKKSKTKNLKVKSFMEFLRERINSLVQPLRRCIVTFCTHIPRSFMKQEVFQTMVSLLDNLSSLESLLSQKNLVSEELVNIFVSKPLEDDFVNSGHMSSINSVRNMSLSLLRTLQTSLGGLKLPVGHREAIKRFCYERASLIFCTTSTSYQLQKFKIEPLKLLVIDEAAQMKECEAIIPLQIPGMRHAILIGDECQLPATVKSNVSSECGLGRSLFERLSSLGHSKHLLNVQYRMHPKISSFPNSKFYHNQILDAENVSRKKYKKEYLSGSMFGSYSFINIVGGKEEGDDVGSKRNMVEMSIVVKIVQKLHKAWHQSKKKVSIGVVSPYTAQVVAIEEKLRYKYEKLDGFSVTVKSIDGFQGGEEDIIILSTVRSNSHGSVGFISSPQRTNVALTRARHCLWILGNERTLARSDSIWKDLVCDAKNRNCLFDADADKCLKKIIIDAKKELEPLNDMVKGNSLLLKHVKWKVLFSDNFRISFGKLMDSRMKNLVVDLLQKLSGGWRPNDGKVDSKTLSKVLKTFMIEGLHVIWTTDIMKETKYIQVLKVWDILPLKEIPKLRKELENIFSAYSEDYMNRCIARHLEGNLEIPKSWLASQEIVQFQKGSNRELSESLLHMKFYSLSTGMVNHLRFGKDIDLPMQLSDEQMDVFLCSKSSFIFGPLGTGKTTILTMKLLQKEESFRDAKVVDVHEESKPTVLRQLFVTVNPKSCYAVKQQVSHLKSFSCDGKPSSETYLLDDADFKSESNVPDTLIGIPEKSYPLVITFQKFLMMLDGTFGNSFFERFHETREGSHGDHLSSRLVALQTFIRLRNVTFERFCSLYWPHFDSNLTKKLDPSRVFTEIVYNIKGGLQVGESCHGYSLLSEGCASTLTKQKRETLNTLFQAYEKMKTERGEFDWGDLVNDLHSRLKSRKYEGDIMDFVYIDEVQDLSMRQISLFKYISQNVDEGFIFAGDTAQTIARGIDFRFEDIRSMFHREFLGTKTTENQKKDHLSEYFQLKQSIRTHGGVVKLAQSVIDILYCYFSQSIDILEPETSLIPGEAPVLLESGNDKNTIVTIFGGKGTSGDIAGFGSEQVILVRDDYTKNEICKYIGKQALVLTISECKGLEFQDVLLYNFFGTSPLEDQWSVIYGYMKEHDWLDEKVPHSFPSFKESRHNVLCSELKQLYVAITRTRQRLWICENKQELSKPMFNYWKRRGLVQVRKLNDSVVQDMQCPSSPQEWLERGKKLFYEKIFVMATMCFEKAGDRMWEKMAKACGLRTSAERMRETNPETASCHLREAAEMFESIGKHEAAISCYCDLGEFETAGKFYLEKCGEIDSAAECFRLTGCYTDAAEAYATGNKFSNCLSLCIKGELFEKGLQYIEYWKKHGLIPSDEIEQLEQKFLESCALSHYEHKDPQSMMKLVKAFCSMESKRNFLRSLGCLDDLMVLEEESGHFLDAAELAGSRGDVMKEANLLEKAGCYEEATLLILWYVFFISLWGNGNTGWPMKQFSQKKSLFKKAKSLAKKHSKKLHDIVCSEINMLSHQEYCLSTLKKQFHNSQQHISLRRNIILIRKILDAHFQLGVWAYDWENELPIDTSNFIEDMLIENHVSVRTLVFYFNLWKDNVMDIFQSLESLENGEPNKHEGHFDFSLNYFGVRKQCVKGNIVYLLVNTKNDWVRNAEIVTLDGKQLVHVMRSYWQSELLSVGLKVLETIQLLYNLSLERSISAFHQSTSLLHMFEVSKFLLDCRYLDLTFHHTNSLQDFLESSRGYLDFVIPLDWRRSICKNLISLRDTELSLHLVEEVILHNPNIELDFTHRTIGRLMMICLSSKKSVSVYEKIIGGLQWNPLWSSFFEKFWKYGFNDVYVALALQNALEETYQADRWLPGYMSPHSFVYLLDRLLFMTSFSYGFFFTTKSSFLEWYTSTLDTTLSASEQMFSKDIVDFLVGIVQDILYNKEETISWIEGSNIVASYYHPLIALKLVMIVALVSLQLSDCSQVLIDLLLGPNNVAYFLPQKFVADLVRRRNGSNLNLSPDVVAEAFASIEDPLLIVSSKDETPKAHAPCAIFVDLRTPTKEILGVLFPSTLGIVLIDGQPCVRKDTTLEEANNSCDDLTTLHKTKNSWDDLTTPHEDNNSWDDMKHPSFAFDVSRPEVELSVSTSGKMEGTDDEHSNGHHSPSNLVLEKESNNQHTRDVEIKKGRQTRRGKGSKKGTGSLNTFATVLVVDGQHSAGEDTTLQQEINTACNDLQQPSSASDKSRPGVDFGGRGGDHVEETGDELIKGDHSVVKLEVEKQNRISDTDQDLGIKAGMGSSRRKRSKSNTQNTLATVLLDRQSCAKEDTTLHEASNSWDDMKLPSFASDMSHHEEEKCDDEHINGGQSLLEKQTTINSTHEAEIKKRKGKDMGRWIKKNEGSKIPSTFTGDGHRNNGDQSSAKLVLKKQTNNDKMKIKNIKVKNMEKCINEKQTNNQKMKIKIDKGKNMEKCINEKQTNNQKMKIKIDKGKNTEKYINEKQANNEKMKIKKEKGKNMEKCITEKKKSSNILHTSTRGELINDLSLVELVLEKQKNNKNSKDVEITKGKGKNIEKWIRKNKESNITLNTFTGEEHRNDDHSLVQSVVKQSINDNTGDKEINKGNKCKKKKCIKSSVTTSTSDLVDVQHYAGEDATPQEEKCACNDMKQHSLASDISLERSNITKEVLQEENHVTETNDEHKFGDHLPLELLLEKQNNNNITQNEENEKGKGKFVAGEDTTMCEANNACNDLNSPSSAFDMGTKATEGIKYGSILDAAVTFLGIRGWRKL